MRAQDLTLADPRSWRPTSSDELHRDTAGGRENDIAAIDALYREHEDDLLGPKGR